MQHSHMKHPHRRHRVMLYHWISGSLRFEEHFLESFAEVLRFLEHARCHSFKVYDWEDELVHHGHGDDDDDECSPYA